MASPKKIKATVHKVVRHSDRVIEYLLQPEGRKPGFKPGQFLHLALDPYDPSRQWPESRVFSMASAPEADLIRIVISVLGNFTTRIANELTEGSEVWLKFPYGNFTFEPKGNNLVLIAGGTGISPYISFLEDCLIKKESPCISLYYGVREEKYIIFEPLLETCRKILSLFNYTVFCESTIQQPSLYKKGGMIDMAKVLRKKPPDSLFYISGPPMMIEQVKIILLENNIIPEKIHIDEW